MRVMIFKPSSVMCSVVAGMFETRDLWIQHTDRVFQGPFDVCRKVFVGGEETARMTINDKSDLFFHDYQFGPLFVQENYPTVTPRAARYNATSF